MRKAAVAILSFVAAAAAGGTMGPVNNPEDQWRSCSGGVKHLPEFTLIPENPG